MLDKELIKQEIERRIESINSCPFRTAELGSEKIEEGELSAYNSMLQFIDSLPKEPASEDLEEAALKYRWEHPFCDGYTAYSFKAGAEWQKQQIMKNAVYGYVSLCHDYPRRRSLVAIADSLTNFEYAEKVKIIVCKTEQ